MLGRIFAKLIWCNTKQPHFALVHCKAVKEPGALVVAQQGEDHTACQCCTN